jgi:hypothetical protein
VKISDLLFGQARGAVWGSDNNIVLGGGNTGLCAIDSESGAPLPLTQPATERGEQYHAWPERLPDGEHVLFSAVTHDTSNIAVLSLKTREWRLIDGMRDAAQPHISTPGMSSFPLRRAVCRPRFRSQLAQTGAAVPVVNDVTLGWNAGLDLAYFAVSPSGTLAYVPRAEGEESQYVGVDRTGRSRPLLADRIRYHDESVGPVSFHGSFSQGRTRGAWQAHGTPVLGHLGP